MLPMRYHPVEIKVQSTVRFEEFDFSYYNRTCFAGLENGLPNCYCNALLQVRVWVWVWVWVCVDWWVGREVLCVGLLRCFALPLRFPLSSSFDPLPTPPLISSLLSPSPHRCSTSLPPSATSS